MGIEPDGRGAGAVSVVAYADRFLVGGFDDAHVRVAMIEPSECGAGPARPNVVGDSRNTDWSAGIATAPDRGFYVVCFLTNGPSWGMHGVTIQAVGEDGTRWRLPFELLPDDARVGGVDCGWNGDEVLVVYSDVDAGGFYSQRLRPTFL